MLAAFLLGFLCGFMVRPLRELAEAIARRRGRDRVVASALADLERAADEHDRQRALSPPCTCGHAMIEHWVCGPSGWSRRPTAFASTTGQEQCTGEGTGCNCHGFTPQVPS